jgi:hypothetical protein
MVILTKRWGNFWDEVFGGTPKTAGGMRAFPAQLNRPDLDSHPKNLALGVCSARINDRSVAPGLVVGAETGRSFRLGSSIGRAVDS